MATVRYEGSINPLLTPFEVGVRHLKLAISEGSPNQLTLLANANIIYETNGGEFTALTKGQRIKHIVIGLLETAGYLTLILPFIALVIDRILNKPSPSEIMQNPILYQESDGIYTFVLSIKVNALNVPENLSVQSIQNLQSFAEFLQNHSTEKPYTAAASGIGTRQVPALMLQAFINGEAFYFRFLKSYDKLPLDRWILWPGLEEGQLIINKQYPNSDEEDAHYLTHFMLNGKPYELFWLKARDFFSTHHPKEV